jgi:hypothetical protein
MKIRWQRFNIYFCLGLAVSGALAGGCKSKESKRKAELATLQLRQEVLPDPRGGSETITVHQDPLVQLTVSKTPFLGESRVKQAKVIDVPGGYELSIEFDREGAWLLEQYAAASQGRHIAIFSQFADPPDYTLNKGRWLAAPKITTHISNGWLIFVPDVTREEAERIALGLNNVAKKLGTNQDTNW